MMGVTGTVGSRFEEELLTGLLHSTMLKMPSFIPSRLKEEVP